MNKRFYIIGSSIAIALVVLFGYCIFAGKKQDQLAKQNQENMQSIMSSSKNIIENNTNEDNKEEFNEIKNNVTETKANEVKAEKNETKTEQSQKTTKQTETKEVEKKQEEQKNPEFKYPVDGDIQLDYAKEKLVFSNTLGEWITHLGVDIKAAKTTVVKASAEGKIKSIKNDPRYGLTVVVEHNNGFSTVYANLLTAEYVKVGEKVTQGQTLGTVGNTSSFEILDESHLHFEILKDGEQIDPNMYLKK